MKNNISIFLLFFAFPFIATSQDNFQYEVNLVYPPLSISKEKLIKANTLLDLNPHYKPSWVKTYISVEVSAIHNGAIKRIKSKNDTLSQAQKKLMIQADADMPISVDVQYVPENTLWHNDIKTIDFTFTVNPEIEAMYVGGQQALLQYLKENAIDKIPDGVFQGYKLSAVKFIINEEGQINNTHIFWSSEDEQVDKLLLETVCNMPTWIPAEYTNGLKVKQEFALMIGNMESCVVNLLNVRL